jgi:adenosine deaminase
MELARLHGIPLPTNDVRDLYSYEDLTEFLEVFWLIQSVLVTPDDWTRLAYESVIDAAPHGLRYREVFFTPARHLAAGQRLSRIIAAIDAGFDVAERVTGVQCRVILDLDRDFGPAAGLEQVHQLVELRAAGSPGAERVIGIGMDSTERGIDPVTYAESYRTAERVGLHRTAHQGENSPAAAIRDAVDVLGCERIDHGISIFEDPSLVARLADQRIGFTVCPSANVRINPDMCGSLAEHVFPKMRAAGLLATLNTDDPGLVGLDLTQEYALCAAAFGYSPDEMAVIALDAVEASWLDDCDKASLASSMRATLSAPLAS